MNNYFTLIYLINELNGNISGFKFDFAISPHKDVLECYLKMESVTYRLILSVRSNEIALFLDDYRPPKKQNVFEFFKLLNGEQIVNILLAKNDRLISICFQNGLKLLFKLFGNNANALLVKDNLIIDSFKHPDRMKHKKTPQPQVPEFNQNITDKAKPKNQLIKLNPLLPRNLLSPLTKQHKVKKMNVEEVKAFTQKVTDALFNDPSPRILENGDMSLWSKEWLNLPTEKSFESVNNCIRYAYKDAVHLRRLYRKKERLVHFLEQVHKKKKAQYQQLLQANKSLERADKYERFGHLLMAHAHQSLPQDETVLEVNNFYNDDESIGIPLKKGLSIAENGERYYDKAKSSRVSYQKARQRIPEVKKEKERLETLLLQLRQIERLYKLDKWIKKNARVLGKFGYGIEDEGQAESPFRKFKVGKYEIWIGKNAKSNDQLTSHAHKEDIWLHARGVSGSHAVIRMGNEKSFPPKNIILRAAAYAAYYSKAKGMKTAPVAYTKRKYVHKPKGAAPGAVVVEREEVEMVPPTKPA